MTKRKSPTLTPRGDDEPRPTATGSVIARWRKLAHELQEIANAIEAGELDRYAAAHRVGILTGREAGALGALRCPCCNAVQEINQ